MKILITTENIGGVWTYSLNLAKGLKKSGHDVHIVIIGDKLTDFQKNELVNTSWDFISSRQEWMQEPWIDLKNAAGLLMDIAYDTRPDLVHLNSYFFGDLLWNCPVVISAHSCILSWWKAVRNEEAPPDWDKYREFSGRGLRAADAVVAPAVTMMKSVEKYYSIDNQKHVIYNGADTALYYSAPKEKFIFSMGRLWDDAKNIKLLLKAAPEIKCNIFIAGDFKNISTADFPRNVHFLGHLTQEQVTGWLSEAALYVLPVIYEPFGYTFLEAALSGCSLVTGDIPSMHEIWEDSAVFVDPHDSSGLAGAINDLMNDDEERNLFAGMAKEKALKNYTIDRMIAEYIKLYDNVLKTSLKKKLKLQES